jgi:hypothetical protein
MFFKFCSDLTTDPDRARKNNCILRGKIKANLRKFLGTLKVELRRKSAAMTSVNHDMID